jgi:3-oxoadipate enol-lactonase
MTDVLLLHAGIGDRRMWAPQLEQLEAAGHRPLAPDLPGFGDASLEAGQLDYVAFAAAQLDKPGAVVGCSFGGRVALELAAARPDIVQQLVLVAPGLGAWDWSEPAQAGFAEEEEAIERGDLAGAAAQQARMWLGEGATPEVRALTAAMTLRSYEQQLPLEGQVRTSWPQPSAEERLGEIATPTLVVVGTGDLPDMQALAEKLARELPNARLETIEAAGHLPSLETPAELNRLLVDFLR